MKYKPGQMVRFTYLHQAVDPATGEKFKEILVLHPWWQNKVHGIDLKRLSPAERKVLELVLDPEMKDVPSRIPLVNNIKKRMDPIELIQNPALFYARFVKPFLNGKDAYRTYVPTRMMNVTVLHDFSIATGKKKTPVATPFSKPEPQQPQQAVAPEKQSTAGMSPIDIMKMNAQNRGGK